MDTCWMPAPSLTIFHCLIQFPQRHSHQLLAFNLVGKMEDQLKVNRAAGAKMKAEKISRGREGVHPALGEELQVHLEVRINSFGEPSGGILDVAALCFIMHAILNQTNR